MTPPRETPPAPALGEIAELLDAIETCERNKWASGGGHVAFGKYQWQQVMAHALTLRARLRTALSDHQGGGE